MDFRVGTKVLCTNGVASGRKGTITSIAARHEGFVRVRLYKSAHLRSRTVTKNVENLQQVLPKYLEMDEGL